MDLNRTFDLTPRTLKQFADNTQLLKKMFENKDTVELFFNRFPFEKLLNVTIMDQKNMSMCMEIINLLSDYKEFYTFSDPINYSMEFILINLSQVNGDCNEINYCLFRLLSKILDNNIKSIDDSFKSAFDRERILDVMVKIAGFEAANKFNFSCYDPILNYLLGNNFPNALCSLISELFEKLKTHEALMEMSIICKHVLNRFKIIHQSMQNIYEWLVENSLGILTTCNNEDLLMELTHCLITFITSFEYMKNVRKFEDTDIATYGSNLSKNLLKISGDICLHSSNPRLRPNCFKLLQFILNEFFEEEKVPYLTKFLISELINELPEDVDTWPQSNNDIFFCICHVVVWFSRMIWKEKDVLSAISRCFYNRKHSVKTFILKSIYFLYPILISETENNDRTTYAMKIMGEDLLNYFIKFSTASHLYSYNNHQLKWMLTKGSKSLKLTVLCQWINTIEDNEILATAITACKAEAVLLDLMLDSNIGPQLCQKLALLLRHMRNSEISRDIAMMLPLTVDKPTIFCNLILAEPSVPLNVNDAELICTLMGAVMPTIGDSEVLKSACKFSSKLLATLKDNPNIITAFCKNIANIRHLIDMTEKVDDDTSIEIIRLLKVLIIVQQYNRIKLEDIIHEDFRIFLRGSQEKVEKSLKLFYYIFAYKHSLISLDEKSILGIYHMILDYSTMPTLYDVAYDCIGMMFKRWPWLTHNIATSTHIEMACLSLYDTSQVKYFFKMLDIWLKMLRKEPYNGYCPIPHQAIKAFITRASLSNHQTEESFTILDELMKKRYLQLRGRLVPSRKK